MNSTRVSVTLAVATVIAWTVKSLVIWQAGGLDKSDFEGPLFLLGLVLCSAAWIAIGVAVSAGRPVVLRVVAGIVGFIAGMVVVQIFDALSGAVVPDSAGWVQEEAGLLTAAVFTLLVALWLRSRGRAKLVAATA